VANNVTGLHFPLQPVAPEERGNNYRTALLDLIVDGADRFHLDDLSYPMERLGSALD
jgi:hypothetical protein